MERVRKLPFFFSAGDDVLSALPGVPVPDRGVPAKQPGSLPEFRVDLRLSMVQVFVFAGADVLPDERQRAVTKCITCKRQSIFKVTK